MDVPEEDGVVFIKNNKEIHSGKFVKCKIVDVKDYDLVAEMWKKALHAKYEVPLTYAFFFNFFYKINLPL